jgi:hypothetical protein
VIKFVSGGFSPGTPVCSTNKTDHHDIIDILLTVGLNTLTLLQLGSFKFTTLVLIGTDCTGSCKSNYHKIMKRTTSTTISQIGQGYKYFNKTDHHDIIDILLTVGLNTLTLLQLGSFIILRFLITNNNLLTKCTFLLHR